MFCQVVVPFPDGKKPVRRGAQTKSALEPPSGGEGTRHVMKSSGGANGVDVTGDQNLPFADPLVCPKNPGFPRIIL